MKPILIPASPGDLLDRISILELKVQHLRDPAASATAHAHLAALQEIRQRHLPPSPQLEQLLSDLRRVNTLLWNAEDAIRIRSGADDHAGVVAAARLILQLNEERCALKQRGSDAASCGMVESKTYGCT